MGKRLSEAELETRSGEPPEGRRTAHLAGPLARNIAALMQRREREMAEQLIGVTMQEQGVSRIVAVDMESAVSMAEAA